MNIPIDPALAREAQSVFQELETNLPAAVAVFLRQTVRQHALPFTADKSEFTDEELAEAHRRGIDCSMKCTAKRSIFPPVWGITTIKRMSVGNSKAFPTFYRSLPRNAGRALGGVILQRFALF